MIIKNYFFIISLFISNLTFGQSLDLKIKFFISQILDNEKNEIIISENASTEIYNLFVDRQNGIDYMRCLFIDNKYYSDSVWNEIIDEKDIKYLFEQIKEYKNFKWTLDKLPNNIIIYSNREVRRYSKKAMNLFNNEIVNNFKIISINHYSLPLFNYKSNFAIIYNGKYSGPLSASSEIEIYLKVDDEWQKIGVCMHSIS